MRRKRKRLITLHDIPEIPLDGPEGQNVVPPPPRHPWRWVLGIIVIILLASLIIFLQIGAP